MGGRGAGSGLARKGLQAPNKNGTTYGYLYNRWEASYKKAFKDLKKGESMKVDTVYANGKTGTPLYAEKLANGDISLYYVVSPGGTWPFQLNRGEWSVHQVTGDMNKRTRKGNPYVSSFGEEYYYPKGDPLFNSKDSILKWGKWSQLRKGND